LSEPNSRRLGWSWSPLDFHWMPKAIAHSYSQVLFSDSTLLGTLMLGLTFIYPVQGLAGLLCCLVAITSVLAIGLSREEIESGYYGLNGMLVGLALGLFFRFNFAFLVVLVLAGALVAVLAVVMKNFLGSLMGLPAMSLPFVFVTILLFLAMQGFANLEVSITPIALARWIDFFELPSILDIFFRSLGAVFFQVSVVVGVAVFLFLLLFSRISALLSIIGFASGTLVYLAVGGALAEIGSDFVGFNFILVAIAIGGVFLVPSWPAYLLAAIASAACALLAAAFHQVLSTFDAPILALPYNLTVICFIYALKFNTRRASLQLVATLVWRPEDSLRHHRAISIRTPHPMYVRLEPPFSGTRLVSQSTDGAETHKDRWAFAWDFVIEENERQADRDPAMLPEHFFVFDTPVLAPADGTVIRTVNYLDDNEVGSVDSEHNWGNCVVLWHYAAVYSGVYHLKKESCQVTEGSHVSREEILGRCGNSGRSAVPHIHLQAQSGPEPGSPTLPALLAGYIRKDGRLGTYVSAGNPLKGELIQRPEPWDEIREAFSLAIGRRYVFIIEGDQERMVTWEVDIDFLGYLFLKHSQSGQRLYFEKSKREVVFGKLSGRETGGLQALLLSAPRVPLCRMTGVSWEDRLPPELFAGPIGRMALDLLRPFGEPYQVYSRTTYAGREMIRLSSTEIEAHLLKTTISMNDIAGSGDKKKAKVLIESRLWFNRYLGPVRLEVDYSDGRKIHLRQKVD